METSKIVEEVEDAVEDVVKEHDKVAAATTIKRIPEIDFFKGIAVLSMVIFHIFYMANMMNMAEFPIDSGMLHAFARTAQLIFISCIGVNLVLSRQKYEGDVATFHKRKTKRAIYMAGVAVIITILTYLAFPDKFVKFGIVHFAATSVFLLQWIAGSEISIFVMVLAVLLIDTFKHHLIPFFAANVHPMISFILGIYNPRYNSMDHFSLIPNIAVIGVGMLLGYTLYKKARRRYKKMDDILDPIFNMDNIIVDVLKWIGKRSFLVYIIHFPLIYFIYRFIQNI